MKKVLAFVLAFTIVTFNSFMLLEGSVVKANQMTDASTSTVPLDVTLNVTGEITLNCPTTTSIGAIAGVTGGSAQGTVACTVITSQSSGYNFFLKASTTPAMQDTTSDSFADYTQATSTAPDYAWSVATNAAEFGYAINALSGAGLSGDSYFLNDGATCNSSTTFTGDACFASPSTADRLVAISSDETSLSGDTITLRFKAEVGNAKNQPTGSYTATMLATAAVK